MFLLLAMECQYCRKSKIAKMRTAVASNPVIFVQRSVMRSFAFCTSEELAAQRRNQRLHTRSGSDSNFFYAYRLFNTWELQDISVAENWKFIRKNSADEAMNQKRGNLERMRWFFWWMDIRDERNIEWYATTLRDRWASIAAVDFRDAP